MRISVRDDPQMSSHYQVINAETGQVVPNVLAADNEDQWYEVYKRTPDGQIAKDADGDQIVLIIQAKIVFRYLGNVP